MILYHETVTLYRVIKSIKMFNPTYIRCYVIHRFRNGYYVTDLVCSSYSDLDDSKLAKLVRIYKNGTQRIGCGPQLVVIVILNFLTIAFWTITAKPVVFIAYSSVTRHGYI